MAENAPRGAFGLRKGEPKARYGFTLPDGTARELAADARGIVKPTSVADARALDAMGLAEVVIEETHTAKGKKTTRTRTVRQPTGVVAAASTAGPADVPDADQVARARAQDEADEKAGITQKGG